MKFPKKELIIIISILLILAYWGVQKDMFRQWVKDSTISSYDACMEFERDREGEQFCLDYAGGSVYSPYPFWKALLLINPN